MHLRERLSSEQLKLKETYEFIDNVTPPSACCCVLACSVAHYFCGIFISLSNVICWDAYEDS